jgi:tetratricopeptide (TPR) repeat protein
VLHRAIEVNPKDATALFLLGSLYLAGGMPKQALQEWETTRGINPAISTLHRNMGYAMLKAGESPERAIEILREGMQYDSHNVDLYLGLEEAMEKVGRPASERARALLGFPELQTAPAVLVFRLVRLLGDAGEFDEAEKQLADRFFPREEGGENVREIYVAVKLKRAQAMAAQGECPAAADIVRHLAEPVASLPFTSKGLDPFITSPASRQALGEIQATCR